MRIISWNVNGIRAVVKKNFIESLEEMEGDIVCLQETKAQDHQVSEALFGIDHYDVFSNSAERKGYSGTAILSKSKPIRTFSDIGAEEHDQEGRVLTAEFEKFYLVNVYVPNSGNELVRLDYRSTWDVAFGDFLAKLNGEKPVIVLGDFNVAHEEIDIARPKSNYNKSAGYTQTEIDGLDYILDKGFADTFRKAHPEKVKYSWWSYRMKARERNVGWRIDYVLVANSLHEKVNHAFILNDIHGSDHCPVGIDIAL